MAFLKYAFFVVRIGSGGMVLVEFECPLTFMENLMRILWGSCGVSIDMYHLGVSYFVVFGCSIINYK